MNDKTNKPMKKRQGFWENPFRKNVKNILLNSRYRIISLILAGLVAFGLFYLLMYILSYATTNWFTQIFIVAYFLLFLYFPVLYAYRSFNQILSELELNRAVFSVRKEIKDLRRQKAEEQNFYALQVKINTLRVDLKTFIEFSAIVTPPIFNYELERLQKGIDIFFNSTSEVLFPINITTSRAQEIQETLDQAYYESVEHPTREELTEMQEEMDMGEITYFDLYALDEFLQYFGAAFFTHVKPYSPLGYKHPINLIGLSRFFDSWNSVVSSCKNSQGIFEQAKKDIEEYYKLIGARESRRRERRSRLVENALLVIISVIASTVTNYLINLPP